MHRFIVGEDYYYITQIGPCIQGKNVKTGQKFFSSVNSPYPLGPPNRPEKVGIHALIFRLWGIALQAYINTDVRNLKRRGISAFLAEKLRFYRQ